MKVNLFRKAALLAGGFALCLTTFMLRPPAPATAQTPPGCIQFGVSQVTHGLDVPGVDDLFLLPTTLGFTVVSPASQGGSAFPVNATTFGGGNPGLPGETLTGLASSTPSSLVRALSCLENFWDVNFYIATNGMTEGDMVTLFLQNPDGSGVRTLAMFTIIGGNARLTGLSTDILVYLNDRNANSNNLLIGNPVPFSNAAGAAGNRTPLITLAFSMLANSGVMGCFELGVDIKRGTGTGTTSVVFSEVVVNRNERAGDRTVNPIPQGLLVGLSGFFPSGAKCDAVCPLCPPSSGGGGGPGKCHTVCFQSDEFFRLKFECLGRMSFLCDLNVIVPGFNFNTPVNACQADDAVLFALKGGSVFGNVPRSDYWLFVQQYVAAQLGLELSASGPARTDALWSNLSCYVLPPGTLPVTLSNGVTISNDSMLKDLFMQAQFAVRENRVNDEILLGRIFLALNGNSIGYSTCNSLGQFR
ncbi:MAG TPA: hypothetical protein VFD58_20365 [Blastocatellia bacterium]|nr:hypothetical protein [Blastocatellia bacterium]